MAAPPSPRKIVPVSLGVAMMGVVVAAAFLSVPVGVPAQANDQYTSPPPITNTAALEISLLVVLIAIALAALLLFLRRRRQGGAGPAVEPESQEPGPEPGPSFEGPAGGAAPPSGAPARVTPAAAGYLEAIGSPQPAPVRPMSRVAQPPPPEWEEEAPPEPAQAAPPEEEGSGEPDIDRLMAELDKISDDILKKTPPKKGLGSDKNA